MTFSVIKRGKSADERSVKGIEKRIGYKLPPEYRAFLLEENAHVIKPCSIRVSSVPQTDAVTLREWTCFYPNETCDANYLLDTYSERIPIGTFPIAADSRGTQCTTHRTRYTAN
jgi:hypothetical protein